MSSLIYIRKPWRFLLAVILLLLMTIASQPAKAEPGEVIRIKPDYRLKRAGNGIVSLYSPDTIGDQEEYVFTDFHADVLLLLYRRIEIPAIEKALRKKYYMSKADARRYVKMTVNELDNWDLIVRK